MAYIVQKGQYGAINKTDKKGYYVVKYASDTFK